MARWHAALALAATLCAAPTRASEPVDYLQHVKPILERRCWACHGALKQEAGLRLDAGKLILKGGDSGPAVVPREAGASLLIERVTAEPALRMPPEGEGEPLAAEEVALVSAWISEGAPFPDTEEIPADPRAHWAFRPPVKVPLPSAANGAWADNPIDAFLAARHAELGITPRPPASKERLLRRVYLDLIGLPPTRAELHAFLADSSPDAYPRVVDRLLASPQYGERWARHWMDVWRYSDWYGRRDSNDVRNSYPTIWRWRDWIVRSLNQDRGYDQMVREMLAADELAPQDDETIVATGYLVRNWFSLNYNQWMRDLVEHTGKAFLGLTFNCCHCHDHKYDPISHEEYFRFRAFFEPLELRRDRVAGQPDPGPFQKYVYASSTAPVPHGMIRVFDEKPDAETYMYAQGDERNRIEGRPPVPPGMPAILRGDALDITPVELPPPAYYPGLKAWIREEERAKRQAAIAAAATARGEAQAALAKLEEAARAAEAQPGASAAAANETAASEPTPSEPAASETAANEAAELARRQRDASQLAVAAAEKRVEAATAELASLEARIAADDARFGLAAAEVDAELLVQQATKAERSARLAAAREKLAAAEHALAVAEIARDAAAEAERQKGVAAAEQAAKQRAAAEQAVEEAKRQLEAGGSDYASLGPVYPKTSSGRRKALAAWITSRENPLAARVAVNHIWLRHFGQPLVETVFDFGRNGKRPTHPELLDWLAVEFMDSGWSMKHLHRLIVTSSAYQMDSGTGGDAASLKADADNTALWHFPARRVEAEVVRDSVLYLSGQLDLRMGGPELDVKTAAEVPRRSMYFAVHAEGGGVLPLLELFDPPDPCDAYRRTTSIVPQQALALTNSALVLGESRRLAGRLWESICGEVADEESRDAAFVTAAWEEVLGRRPSEAEQRRCREFLERQAALYQETPAEQLAAGSVPGQIAPSPDKRQRARESLVRSLLNHNEFVTLR